MADAADSKSAELRLVRVQIPPPAPQNGRAIMIHRPFSKSFLVVLFLLTLPAELLPNPWAIEDMIGKPAPAFTLPDLNGGDVSITDFRGKVVLLNFWATWCPPCRTEMSRLNSLKKDFNSKTFEVVTVSTDRTLSPVLDFVRGNNISLIVLHDSEIKVSRRYNVFSLPTSFLLNRKGVIVERFFGEHNWDSEQMRSRIEELL